MYSGANTSVNGGERAVVVVVRDGTGAAHDDRIFERSRVRPV
ncbi:MAG: hypothetical protein J07HQX50_02815 [Haloquadratum sp. J07HQX50]|nr:MAG: hypothetical protein J07HQX50_02815 [Haloquadratum sp. J07HQX50]